MKRKTDLFRFATLRAPQLISTRKRMVGFVAHPSPSDSGFLNGLQNLPDLQARRAQVRSSSGTFVAAQSVEEVKQLSGEMYEFALWLAENKNNLDRATLDSEVPVSQLSLSQQLRLWDNVFYDILVEKNPYVRQACLLMLVANNFAANYQTYSPLATISHGKYESEMNDLKRLANAKVVLDRAFSEEKATAGTAVSYNQIPAPIQVEVHSAKLASLRIPVLKRIKEELRGLSATYEAEYENGFSVAKAAYEASVEQMVATYLNDTPVPQESTTRIAQTKLLQQESPQEKYELKETKDYPESISIEDHIPVGLVADFSFEFARPLSDGYRQGKLSGTADRFVQSKRLQNASIEESIAALDREIAAQEGLASKSHRKQYKEVLFNGVQTRRSDLTPLDFALSIHSEAATGEYTSPATGEVYLSLHTGYDGSVLKRGEFVLNVGTDKHLLTDVQVISSKDQTLFLRLGKAGGLEVPEYATYSFQATIELENGKNYRMEKLGSNNSEVDSGIAVPDAEHQGEPVHYGVNRIGVAEYRRVEQELCCYIPGEVSHIENILAREYKEKNTRRLLSSESTTQTTTEREIEESTDTSTTARFELSSEIAEVLQKDRNLNLGFSTGISGELAGFNFNAGAYGDFSMGQSSSESNSIARNYAEDVTRRALERIVQRVMVSRTSRILQEFEENNRHGYDNREGTEHVTGVFRWIDKVYKNRIVNYSRRLLYEFMVPEPARFYKEAIIIKAEEEAVTTTNGGSTGSTTVGVKPDAPSTHGINSASDITRANYLAKCALYGVNPPVPLDQNIILTKSYAQHIGGTDAEKSYTYPPDMMIPTEYEGCHLKFDASYQFTAQSGAKAYMKVSSAGRNWTSPYYSGKGGDGKTVNWTLSGVTGSVGATVVTKKMREFNLSMELKCCLKSSVYSQWQQDVYQAIMAAYNALLDDYNNAQQVPGQVNAAPQQVKPEDTRLNLNPKFNAKVVLTELKRLCIEMLTRPFNIQQGRELVEMGGCEVPRIKLGPLLDLYGSQVKFFEQAFDWNLMSQMFYPYYWAKRCDWKDLFQAQVSDDHIFQAFLQSGMARVVVPVRPGFEDAVIYYLETGKIWNGTGLAIDTDDELYVSILDEMAQPTGTVEGEEWETIVPSTLTIVQARSAMLDEEGLPCCKTDQEVLDALNIEPSTNILTLKTQ